MIRDAQSAIVNDLEKIRGAPPKFMTLNDDLDVALPPDERARMLTEVRELLETLYPYRSPFELPLEEEEGEGGRRRRTGEAGSGGTEQ